MNTHSDLHEDLAGAYALDSLDEEERTRFEEHLVNCAVCKREVAELSQVVGVLALATEPIEPPAQLRSRLLEAVEADMNERRQPAFEVLSGGLPSPRKRSRIVSGLSFLGVAAALLIAALGAYDLRLQNRVDQQQAALQYQQQVASAVTNRNTVMPLASTAGAPTALASMVQPKNGRPAYIIVAGLPSTPSNSVYQLWLIRGGTPRSAVTFRVSGSGPEIVQLPWTVRGYTRTALTEEPGPTGSPYPTGKTLLRAQLGA